MIERQHEPASQVPSREGRGHQRDRGFGVGVGNAATGLRARDDLGATLTGRDDDEYGREFVHLRVVEERFGIRARSVSSSAPR